MNLYDPGTAALRTKLATMVPGRGVVISGRYGRIASVSGRIVTVSVDGRTVTASFATLRLA